MVLFQLSYIFCIFVIYYKNMKQDYKRQQRTVGAIVEINLNNGYKTYARILKNHFAFYNTYTKNQPDIEKIISSDVLFISAVYDYTITKGRWLKIGKKKPLEEKLNQTPPFYTQDFINPEQYTIYHKNTKRSATKEECQGLELFAVWKPEAIEKRLNDHFTGNVNKIVEKIKQAEVY